MPILENKVAIVTGAGQGVGRGIAHALAREGAAIVMMGRTRATLAKVQSEIESFGGRATVSVGDVKSAKDIEATVAHALSTFGGIDILINNAQEVALGKLLDVSDEAFTDGFTSGPLATFRLMKACHPHFVARGGGAIVNLATAAAVRWDMSTYGAYAAVKQATRALTRAACAEWGADNIRVNTIAPHAMSPGMEFWIQARPAEAAEFIKTIPAGRVGDCEKDIGRAVVFLVGPDAGYLSGATIPLDGGQANFD
jgi:meso-butanediol dehydrogenase/(S,S)-butanediol dehydrogenase/diacetyl reductase